MGLHEKYQAKGLSVIMLSTEDKATVEPYPAENKIPFIVAVSDRSVLDSYQVSGYPSSYLIDGAGKVVWQGHPMALREAEVEEALKTVQLFSLPEVAPSLKSAKAAFEGERFVDAHKKALSILKKGDEREKADAQMIVDKVKEAADKRIEWAEAAAKQGDYSAAFEHFKWVQARFKGLDAEKVAKDREKSIRNSPEAKKELRAGRILDALIKKVDATRGVRNKKKFIPAFDAFARKYPGTKAAKRASDKSRELNNLLE